MNGQGIRQPTQQEIETFARLQRQEQEQRQLQALDMEWRQIAAGMFKDMAVDYMQRNEPEEHEEQELFRIAQRCARAAQTFHMAYGIARNYQAQPLETIKAMVKK